MSIMLIEILEYLIDCVFCNDFKNCHRIKMIDIMVRQYDESTDIWYIIMQFFISKSSVLRSNIFIEIWHDDIDNNKSSL